MHRSPCGWERGGASVSRGGAGAAAGARSEERAPSGVLRVLSSGAGRRARARAHLLDGAVVAMGLLAGALGALAGVGRLRVGGGGAVGAGWVQVGGVIPSARWRHDRSRRPPPAAESGRRRLPPPPEPPSHELIAHRSILDSVRRHFGGCGRGDRGGWSVQGARDLAGTFSAAGLLPGVAELAEAQSAGQMWRGNKGAARNLRRRRASRARSSPFWRTRSSSPGDPPRPRRGAEPAGALVGARQQHTAAAEGPGAAAGGRATSPPAQLQLLKLNHN